MEPQATYDHSQDLINRAAFFILACNIYGPDAQAAKGAAYALAVELQKASYRDTAAKDLLGTASLAMDEELAYPADVPNEEFVEAVYDTLYNVAAIHFGYFLEPTGNPEFEATLRRWAAQSKSEAL